MLSTLILLFCLYADYLLLYVHVGMCFLNLLESSLFPSNFNMHSVKNKSVCLLRPIQFSHFFPEYLFSHIVVLVELFMIFLWSGYISALCISLKWEDSFILASSLWLSVLQIITSMFPEKLELLENHRSTFWTIFTIYELGVKYRASHLRYCLAVCLIMKMHKSAYFLCCNL